MTVGALLKTLITNTYHVAGMSRRQIKNFITFSKTSTFWNFITIFVITNHHEKCIEISPNMTGIGLVICENRL